jgi:hypothetical protein
VNLRSAVERVVGVVLIDDELVEQCRRNVKLRCETVDVSKYRRIQAQEALGAEARLAIVDTFADRTGRNYQVGRTWPGAFATIKGSKALIDIDIGIDHFDDGDGVDVIEIAVFRSVQLSSLAAMLKGLVGMTPKPPLDLTEKLPPAPPPPPPPAPAPVVAKGKVSVNDILNRKR